MKTVNYMQPGPALQGYATVPATSDAKEYLRLLLRHKFGLLMTLLLGIGLAALYLISTTPVYEAVSLIEVNERSGVLDEGNQTPDWNAPTIKEEANILKSRKVLQPVVDLYDLRNNIEANKVPVLGDVTARIPKLASWIGSMDFAKAYAWNEETLDISDFSVPREWEDETLTLTSLGDNNYSFSREGAVLVKEATVGEKLVVQMTGLSDLTLQVNDMSAPAGVEFAVTRNSLEETISSFRSSMSTETTDTKSRMITVKLRGDNPTETAELTNEIVKQYRDVKLSYETLESTTERQILEQTLPQVEADLRSAENKLSKFRVGNQAYNTDAQMNIKLAQLDKLEQERTELEIEKADIAKRYTASHPDMKRIDKRLGVLESQILKVRGTISIAPRVERDLTVLEEEVDTKRVLFREMSEKLQRIRIAEAGNVGSVQIWDKALAPKKPVSPNTMLAIVGATLATLFLYMLYLTLRSALTTVISDQESLERASGLPVFMNIPKSGAQKRIATSAPTVDPRRLLPGSGDSSGDAAAASANVLALKKPEDYSVENLRGLRSMLEDVMSGARNNVLMITSPLPSMGKSFVSLNLAVLLAQAGKRVLLIDSDYQRGQLHKNFGLQMGPGLPEVVRGKSELKETVKPTSVPNLYIIPRGFMGNGVAREMPSDQEFGAFMNVVAPRFDIAIIDTPPVLSVSTAATLGKHAGSTLMVVKEGEVKEPQLAESLKRLSFSGVQVNGCIMNASSAPTPRHYAYYREQLD